MPCSTQLDPGVPAGQLRIGHRQVTSGGAADDHRHSLRAESIRRQSGPATQDRLTGPTSATASVGRGPQDASGEQRGPAERPGPLDGTNAEIQDRVGGKPGTGDQLRQHVGQTGRSAQLDQQIDVAVAGPDGQRQDERSHRRKCREGGLPVDARRCAQIGACGQSTRCRRTDADQESSLSLLQFCRTSTPAAGGRRRAGRAGHRRPRRRRPVRTRPRSTPGRRPVPNGRTRADSRRWPAAGRRRFPADRRRSRGPGRTSARRACRSPNHRRAAPARSPTSTCAALCPPR